MRYYSFYERASRTFRDHPSLSKLLVVVTVSGSAGGSLLAFSDSKPYDATVSSPETEIKKKKVVVLGTGWAGTSFLRNLKNPSYDIQVISPRNYFAFTPLLPSVTCGTVEARSIVEPIRKIVKKKGADVHFWEAECLSIDPVNKKVNCRSTLNADLNGKAEFSVDYDYLVVAMGARSNTFNIPGVEEHAHFLKEVEDALKIRRGIIDCFEKANLPTLSDDDRKKILHFVVVGGGPTGVEFSAELHDFVTEDLGRLYPKVKEHVKITLLEATDHILNMFDKRITAFAEEKFHRNGINLQTGSMVVKVTDKEITTKALKNGGEVSSVPYGMMVWSTGIGTRPVIRDFMNKVGQANRRALGTDEWLRVEGTSDIYALGDCATIVQRKVMICSNLLHFRSYQVLLKLKRFLWRACLGNLAVMASLYRRHVRDWPLCLPYVWRQTKLLAMLYLSALWRECETGMMLCRSLIMSLFMPSSPFMEMETMSLLRTKLDNDELLIRQHTYFEDMILYSLHILCKYCFT